MISFHLKYVYYMYVGNEKKFCSFHKLCLHVISISSLTKQINVQDTNFQTPKCYNK